MLAPGVTLLFLPEGNAILVPGVTLLFLPEGNTMLVPSVALLFLPEGNTMLVPGVTLDGVVAGQQPSCADFATKQRFFL